MELSYILICLSFAIVAFLYASVGHGGASGYIAVMAIAGYAPENIRTTALILNISVSLIAFLQFYRSGHFKSNLFIPLVLASIPMAFLGGLTPIHHSIFKITLGILLLIPAIRFSGFYQLKNEATQKPFSIGIAILLGLSIGYISGLTGIGGGIILSPILIYLNWTNMKQTAAISAGFIFLNSLSGLAGLSFSGLQLDTSLIPFIFLTIIGGLAGSYLGASKLNAKILSRILGVVLIIASFKLLLT